MGHKTDHHFHRSSTFTYIACKLTPRIRVVYVEGRGEGWDIGCPDRESLTKERKVEDGYSPCRSLTFRPSYSNSMTKEDGGGEVQRHPTDPIGDSP